MSRYASRSNSPRLMREMSPFVKYPIAVMGWKSSCASIDESCCTTPWRSNSWILAFCSCAASSMRCCSFMASCSCAVRLRTTYSVRNECRKRPINKTANPISTYRYSARKRLIVHSRRWRYGPKASALSMSSTGLKSVAALQRALSGPDGGMEKSSLVIARIVAGLALGIVAIVRPG